MENNDSVNAQALAIQINFWSVFFRRKELAISANVRAM